MLYQLATSQPVAYAGFKKGGGGQELQKIWEEQRSECKLFHPKSAWFSAQNWVKSKKKNVFNQIWSYFLPKLGCEPETNVQSTPKKRSSLKSNPVFGQKKSLHPDSVRLCAQTFCVSNKGRGCVALLHIILCEFYYPGDPKGGAMAPCPPLNTPLVVAISQLK